jgi:hypothetical protein
VNRYPRYLVNRWIIPRVFRLTIYTFEAWDHWRVLIDVGLVHGETWTGKELTYKVPRRVKGA